MSISTELMQSCYALCRSSLHRLAQDHWAMSQTLSKYPMDYFFKSPVAQYLNQLFEDHRFNEKLAEVSDYKCVTSVHFTHHNVNDNSCRLLTGGYDLFLTEKDDAKVKTYSDMSKMFRNVESHEVAENCKLPSLVGRYLVGVSNQFSFVKNINEQCVLNHK